jgi:micrococcal nuclease
MAKTVVDISRLAKYAWFMATLSASKLYHYRATITSVYDGDTCTADVDLGFKVTVRGEKIRLARINAPEICGANRKVGLASRDYLRELILGHEVLLKTIKDKRGKSGRYLGEIIVKRGRRNLNVNNALVTAGHAVFAEY